MKTYWVDGGYANDRGYGSYCDDEGHITHFALSKAETNNEAEYLSLIELLKTLDWRPNFGPTIYTDSMLLVGQLEDDWKCKARNLRPLRETAKWLLAASESTLKWVPRIEILRRLGH